MPTCSDSTTRSAAGATLAHRLYRGAGIINHAGHDTDHECDAILRLLDGQEPTVRIDWTQRKADRQAASAR